MQAESLYFTVFFDKYHSVLLFKTIMGLNDDGLMSLGLM